jgi:hypothetical protein
MWVLLPVLKVLFGWVASAVMKEVKEAWSDKQIQKLAGEAVNYAQAKYTDNAEKKQAAIDKLREGAKEVSIKIGKDVASEVIELAVERYLKS